MCMNSFNFLRIPDLHTRISYLTSCAKVNISNEFSDFSMPVSKFAGITKKTPAWWIELAQEVRGMPPKAAQMRI